MPFAGSLERECNCLEEVASANIVQEASAGITLEVASAGIVRVAFAGIALEVASTSTILEPMKVGKRQEFPEEADQASQGNLGLVSDCLEGMRWGPYLYQL